MLALEKQRNGTELEMGIMNPKQKPVLLVNEISNAKLQEVVGIQ
jgi:hypothetical protein